MRKKSNFRQAMFEWRKDEQSEACDLAYCADILCLLFSSWCYSHKHLKNLRFDVQPCTKHVHHFSVKPVNPKICAIDASLNKRQQLSAAENLLKKRVEVSAFLHFRSTFTFLYVVTIDICNSLWCNKVKVALSAGFSGRVQRVFPEPRRISGGYPTHTSAN